MLDSFVDLVLRVVTGEPFCKINISLIYNVTMPLNEYHHKLEIETI